MNQFYKNTLIIAIKNLLIIGTQILVPTKSFLSVLKVPLNRRKFNPGPRNLYIFLW